MQACYKDFSIFFMDNDDRRTKPIAEPRSRITIQFYCRKPIAMGIQNECTYRLLTVSVEGS